MIEKIKKLFEKANQLQYDEQCGMGIVEKMQGPGFFPGCNGLHDNQSGSVNKFVMVVGQDFDTKINYDKLGDKGEVDSNTTWRNLKKLLIEINIQESNCFFTNVYMGLRKDGKNTGPSPAKKSPNFSNQCQVFFKEQLRVINPELVLILGKEPAKFIAETFPNYFTNWQQIGLLKEFYQEEKNIYNDLEFENKSIRFLFALHPSMSNTNRSLIWGKGNKEKETEMLKKHLSGFYAWHV
jgi:uracil-DNA glycosylase family 4